jgi:hypothetical protein
MGNSSDVLSAAMALPERERADVILALLESLVDQPSLSDGDLLDEAERRDAMVDADPGMELSHEEFMEAFSHRRKK